jgi:hypothetical protein
VPEEHVLSHSDVTVAGDGESSRLAATPLVMGRALVLGTHMLPVTVDFEDQQQHAARVEVVDGSGTPVTPVTATALVWAEAAAAA